MGLFEVSDIGLLLKQIFWQIILTHVSTKVMCHVLMYNKSELVLRLFEGSDSMHFAPFLWTCVSLILACHIMFKSILSLFNFDKFHICTAIDVERDTNSMYQSLYYNKSTFSSGSSHYQVSFVQNSSTIVLVYSGFVQQTL